MSLVMKWDARIGGVLVAPRSTLARLADGEARAADVAWLLVAKLVAQDLPSLVRGLLLAREEGIGAGIQALLIAAQALLPDVLGILIAGVVMSFFVGKGARGYGRTLELAAYAWVPYFAVELAVALFYSLRAVAPSPSVQHIVDAVSLMAGGLSWTWALLAARAPKEAST
jgi:hypothetical protein